MRHLLESIAEGKLTSMTAAAVAELGQQHEGLIGAACAAELRTRQPGNDDATLEAEELAEETR